MATPDDETDRLLRGLSVPDEPGEIDVRALLDYRAGALDEDAAAEVEALLSRSREARDLLASLPDEVPPRLTDWAVGASPAPARSRRWVPVVIGFAAAAAVVAMFLFSRPEPRPEVPPFSMSVGGGIGEVRGEEAPAGATFLPHTQLKLVLTPEEASWRQDPRAPLPLRVYVQHGDEALQAVDVPVERGAGGAARIVAPARAFFGDRPGRKRVFVVLGTEEDLSRATPADAREAGRVLEAAVEYRLEAPP